MRRTRVQIDRTFVIGIVFGAPARSITEVGLFCGVLAEITARRIARSMGGECF